MSGKESGVTMHPKPSRAARLASKRATRKAEAVRRGELRQAAARRAGGRCEWCQRPIMVGELHHIMSGSRRRTHERIDTVAFVCGVCHHLWHGGDPMTLALAGDWARLHGYLEVREEIRRRLTKVTERRSA